MVSELKIYYFIKDLSKRFKKHEVTALGAQLTYYLLLSFFPFLIFLITIVSYTPITHEDILINLSTMLPNQTYNMVISIIEEILESRSTSLLSIGMIATLWTASNGIKAIIRGVNKAYNEREKRSFIKTRIISMAFTIALVIAILFAFIAIIFGKLLGEKVLSILKFPIIFNTLWGILRFVIPLAGLILIFALIYKYTPTCKVKFKEALPGAIFSSLGWLITSSGFSYYVNNFNNFTKTYGSIGGIIVLLIWLYISSIIVLIGGEINASLHFINNKNLDIESKSL